MSKALDQNFRPESAFSVGAAAGDAAGFRREPAAEAATRGGALVRLAKPGIIAAVLLAGFAGMVLAARGWPGARTALLTLVALLLASAGSALLNGVLDAPLDERMARLRKRSAALTQLGRPRVAAAALGGMALGPVLALATLNALTAVLLLAAVLSYTLVYTLFLKRRSPWGAVPGGVPGALPVLIGYAAVNPALGADAVILFTILFLWQPPHFWTLALDSRDDYAAAGIPALPVARGERYTVLLCFVYAASLLPASLALWLFGSCSAWYAGAALLAWLAFMTVSCRLLVARRQYKGAFAASIAYLLALLLAIIGDVCLAGGTLP